jgi:hypothetical protein
MKEKSVSLKLYLKDLGYGSTFSSNVIFTVFEQLSIFPVNAPQRLTDQEVSGCLAMMAVTHSGLYFNPTLLTILGYLL